MAEHLDRRLSSIGSLAEPVRRALYFYVAAQPESVSRDQAAAETGYPRHAVKFHLDRLVAEGLLEVEFRRLSGRQGPGAGRPSKLYRRPVGDVSVSLPERRYDLAGAILADAIHGAGEGEPIEVSVARSAAAAGRRIGAALREEAAEPISAIDALTAIGYEPRPTPDQTILVNCPFHSLAVDHTELVCGMNLGFIKAMATEVDPTVADIRLNPAPGRCCVTLDAPHRR